MKPNFQGSGWLVIAGGVIALALGGCHQDAPSVAKVSGTVTHQGKVIPNLTINFIPSNGRPSWGLTDSGGYYTLHWDEDYDGAEIGTHQVSVAFVPGSQGDEGGRAKNPPATPRRASRDHTQVRDRKVTVDLRGQGRQSDD